MDELFNKPYDPKTTERRIYQLWEESGFLNPDRLPNRHQKPFTVTIAPPNVTGSLHIGHALENTLLDVLIRYRRMQGFKTLWLPGTDHAGIATQSAVRKNLKKRDGSQALTREELTAAIWQWREKYGNIILDQLKRLGCSLDWSRLRFTLDEKYQAAVRAAFQHYWEKGLIYRGERVVNWCPKDQTALSDLELEYTEETAFLWYLKYPLADGGFIEVATTRPETMLGDTAVAVNPEDPRYQNLIGQKIILPLTERTIPLVADPAVDPTFGSGAVKLTPAHSIADNQIAERQKLPQLKIINERGRIENTSTSFDGLAVALARDQIISALETKGLLAKKETVTHRLARCYRCGAVIENLPSKQWFLKMRPLADRALASLERGEVVFHPERWQKVAADWLRNVRDWCLSRQIWWGHPIPVDGEVDVFDTWFSSALWPFATLGWPDSNAPDLKTYYPTQLISSARDIIHLWISRMIFSGLEFTGQPPFQTVLIHPTVLNKQGQRMSKSLGTGIDPMALIETYGADALRFGLLYQTFQNQDLRFSDDDVRMGKKFANKFWNISRFVVGACGKPIKDSLPTDFRPATKADEDWLRSLRQLVETFSSHLENYRFGEASHLLYDFIWHRLADDYLEASKKDLTPDKKIILGYTLITLLKILHPLMPHLTEEVYRLAVRPGNQNQLLMIAPWPRFN